jgi:polysaccharide export outer membrane protein
MTRSSALMSIWLMLASASFIALAQTQPPTQPAQQPPATAPVSSPAIIALPSSDLNPGTAAKIGDKIPEQTSVAPPKDPKSSKAPASKSAKSPIDPKGAAPADTAAVGAAYVIGPEDYLFIRVWRSPEFSGTVSVGPDGTISMQLINEVKATGLTARELADVLADRLKEFLTTPEVNVQVLAARSRTYIILGDGVARPGVYPLPKPLTVLEALIAGGSFSPFAKKNKIYVLRGTQKFNFNWNEVSKGKKIEQNIFIQNGDKIYVP